MYTSAKVFESVGPRFLAKLRKVTNRPLSLMCASRDRSPKKAAPGTASVPSFASLTRVVFLVVRSRRKMSVCPPASLATNPPQSLWNSTFVPSAFHDPPVEPRAGNWPASFVLTRTVVPVWRSRANSWVTNGGVFGSRSVARLSNSTYRPSGLIFGFCDRSFPLPVPAAFTLASSTRPVARW